MKTFEVGLQNGTKKVFKADRHRSIKGELLFYVGDDVVAAVAAGGWTYVEERKEP
jgi:hypothetical protein